MSEKWNMLFMNELFSHLYLLCAKNTETKRIKVRKRKEREGEGSIRRLTLLNIHFKNKKSSLVVKRLSHDFAVTTIGRCQMWIY